MEKNKILEGLDKALKIKSSTGSGSTYGYAVEAKTKGPAHKVSEDHILTNQWSRVYFPESKDLPGIPNPGCYDSSGQLKNHNLYSWSSAQALRWWFHSIAESHCIETRIVKYKIEYSFSIEKQDCYDEVNNDYGPEPDNHDKLESTTSTSEK